MIAAAGAPGRLDVTFVAAAAGPVDQTRRTIAGVAVPWNVPGVVASGDTVIFHPGSLDATARPPALRDHDRARPFGAVIDAADTGTELTAVVRASRTPDGDDALILAADGGLPMFSVGADPLEYSYDDAGVLHVYAARWLELSLLTIGAYADARVLTVTATTPGGPAMPPDELVLTDDPPDDDDVVVDDPDVEPNPDIEPDEPVETPDAVLPPRVPVTAGRGGRPRGRPTPHPFAGVGIRQLAGMIQAAQVSADPRVVRQVHQILTSPGARAAGSIQAALTDVTLVGTPNIGPMQRPGYQAELVELVSHGSPLVDVIRQGDLQRGDYPQVTFNQWVQTPTVALQAAEKTEINSTPLEITPTGVDVETWATGNDISQQILDFGSPSFVEDYIRAAGVDYARVIQLYAATLLLGAAAPVTTDSTDNITAIVGKLLGALNPDEVPAGGLFLAMSWDAFAGIMGVTVNEGPAFWSGNISFGSILPSTDMGGLSAFYAPGLPARTYLLGLRNAATWYDLPGTPFSLRAINVGQLGLDIAVYGYGALGVQYPGALVKTTVPAPVP